MGGGGFQLRGGRLPASSGKFTKGGGAQGSEAHKGGEEKAANGRTSECVLLNREREVAARKTESPCNQDDNNLGKKKRKKTGRVRPSHYKRIGRPKTKENSYSNERKGCEMQNRRDKGGKIGSTKEKKITRGELARREKEII